MPDPAALGAAPRGALVARRALVERLSARFDARVTVMVGGAGSGKTTTLTQAMSVDSGDIDVWHPCSLADRDAAHLEEALAAACRAVLGGRRSADEVDPLDLVADLVLGVSPRQVCLVVDDVHHLLDGGVLDALIDRLPTNGHLLVAGRRPPPIRTARLDAAGQLLEISQDDLLLSPAEQVEFANLRGIDVALLDGAGGWPAFVELASAGAAARTQRYLEQEALGELGQDRRHALAAFAAVGGGDDDIARAVAGLSLVELVDGLPLVRWSGTAAQLHDLWVAELETVLDARARIAAIEAATAVHRARGDVDRAVELAASVDRWDDVEASITAAVRVGVDGGLTTRQLLRWSSSLAAVRPDSPVTLLLDAMIERDRDPTSAHVADRFELAAHGFAARGDDELELAALMQVGYLARIAADADRIGEIMARVAALGERYPPATAFLDFGAAWQALANARPDLLLESTQRLLDVELPDMWQATRDHLIATALFSLGRPEEAFEVVPKEIHRRRLPIPGALITESQTLWYSGSPELALDALPRGLGPRFGSRDRFLAGAWIAKMQLYRGDVDAGADALRVARAHGGDQPAAVVATQVAALGILLQLMSGDEDGASQAFTALIEQVPLETAPGRQALLGHIPVSYVLGPGTRAHWDAAELGPSHRRARRLAVTLVRAREGDLGPIATDPWPEPGVIAAELPVVWAVEFALHGVRAGRHEGRQLASWLGRHWGESARRELHRHADGDEAPLSEAARSVLAQTPTPPHQQVDVGVLGATTVCLGGRPTADPNWRRERVRALLTWLILRRAGTREQVAGALWPDLSIERAARNLRTTLNYLNDVLEPWRGRGEATWFVRSDGPLLSLDESLDVDVWRFDAALDRADRAERNGHPTDALDALLDAVGWWSGDLAADLDHDWLDLERIHVRSRFVRASCRAGELLVATGLPGDAIEVIAPALRVDPFHEPSTRALSSAYLALGDATSARAVVARAEKLMVDGPTTG